MEFCDDQVHFNNMLDDSGVSWFDLNQTVQDNYWKSPIRYHKIGITGENGDGFTNLEIMVMSSADVLRGDGVDNCATTWIMNPLVGGTSQTKLGMLNRYKSCLES